MNKNKRSNLKFVVIIKEKIYVPYDILKNYILHILMEYLFPKLSKEIISYIDLDLLCYSYYN